MVGGRNKEMEYETSRAKRLRRTSKSDMNVNYEQEEKVSFEGMTLKQLIQVVKEMRTEQKVMAKEIEQMEDDLSEAYDKIDELETELKAVKATQNKSESTQTRIVAPYAQILKKNIANLTNEERVIHSEQVKEANQMYDEASERERRKKNVVIFGLPESKNEKAEEKRKDDEKFVRQILTKLEVNDVQVNKIIRYKKKSEKMIAPIVIVELENEKQRNAVLYASKKLRNIESCEKLYLNADLTPLQRAGFNDLKRQRDELNKNEKDKNVRHAIRGNNLVKFKVSPTQSQ